MVTKIKQNHLFEWLIWVAFTALLWAQTDSFAEPIAEFKFGADGWPRVILASLAFGATAQLILNMANTGSDQNSDRAAHIGSGFKPVNRLQQFGIFVLPFIYLWFMHRMGFFFVTPIFILAYLWILEVRRWTYLICVSLGVYAFVLFVFVRLFYVAMPVGSWPMFYDFSNWIITIIRMGV